MLIRLAVALGILGAMMVLETITPRRAQTLSRSQRWPINLGLAVFNSVLLRLTLAGAATFGAVTAASSSFGLFNTLATPQWLSFTLSLLLLDFAVYCQHVVSHRWPLLWRLHQVHHTDLEFDATTAVRFHPLEIIISMAYKLLCIFLIGADPFAVLVFEMLLNGAATFNHSNVFIPAALEKKLRWILITPDLHRIHHSTVQAEMDSNYGFSISVWDRLCKTYRPEPRQAQTTMPIGLNSYRDVAGLKFTALLLLPFKPIKRS